MRMLKNLQRKCVCRKNGDANAYASRRRRKASQEVSANAQDGINGGVGRVAESAYPCHCGKSKGLKRGDKQGRRLRRYSPPGRGTPRWRSCAANSLLSASNALRNELRADEGAIASKRAPRRPGPAKLATDGLEGERRKPGARGMAGRGGGVRGGLPGGVAGERRARERTIDGTSDGAAVERRDE